MVGDLESKLSMSNRCLEASLNKEKEQQGLMLQLQLQQDRLLMANNNNNNNKNKQQTSDESSTSGKLTSNDSGVGKLSTASSSTQSQMTMPPKQPLPRAKTAPQTTGLLSTGEKEKLSIQQQQQQLQQQLYQQQLQPSNKRNQRAAAYSSPALFTLEKFMQSFRARSQLLTETLEENDCVLQNRRLVKNEEEDDDDLFSGGGGDEGIVDNDLIRVEGEGDNFDEDNDNGYSE
jgi:hypothetical protein